MMWKMRLAMIAAAALAYCSSCAAQALSFKGIEIGSAKPDEVVAKFPSAKRYGSTISARAHGADAGGELFRLGPTSAGDFEFFILDGVVQGVEATFTHESFPGVLAVVKAKYGEPTETKTAEVRNRRGATFPAQTITWKRPDGEIVIRERAGRVDRMQLSMRTPALEKKREDEMKRAIERAAHSM